MIRRSFEARLEELKDELIRLGEMVEEAIQGSVTALKEQDLELAEKILSADDQIDDREIKIEEKCTKLIALQQPVAGDLRTIMAISKIANDLERCADHAGNIARKVQLIGTEPLIKPLIDIPRMTEIATRRLRQVLDAFVQQDAELAHRVAAEDEELDLLDEQIMRELLTFMAEDLKTIEQATSLMFISRFLERIGDHSTNLCEMIIYMINGERKAY